MDDTNRLHPKVLNGRYAIMFCFMLLNLQWQFSVDTYGLNRHQTIWVYMWTNLERPV